MSSSRRMIHWFDRYTAIPGLVTTSAVCYALLALHVSNYRASEDLREWIGSQRALVTITVQVVSHILGLIHVQTICALIRVSFAVSLRKRPFPLYWAQFVQNASTPRMSWDLPWKFCLLLYFIVASSFFPAAIWAPALAPLPAEQHVYQSLAIPSFEASNVSTLWDGDKSTVINAQWMSNQGGLFSFDPAVTKSLMQTSSSDASVKTDGLYKHAKLDKTGYTYISRSKGAGSVAGFHQFTNVKSPLWFTYQEDVLNPYVNCFYSTQNRWNIERVNAGSVVPRVYQTYGRSPSNVSIGGSTYIGWLDHDIVTWGVSYEKANQSIAVQFVTLATKTDDDWGFNSLNFMQCNIGFKPQTFTVVANTTGKLITTNPSYGITLPWPKYGDAVVSQLSNWLFSVSWLDSGCFGGCPLGRSIIGNVRQLQNATGDATSNATVLRAVEDYISTMTDNILVNLLLTRMASNAPQATKSVPVLIAVPSIVFGDTKFIYIVCSINMLLTMLYLFECIRTRAWSGVSDFDISNMSSVLISALRGGMAFERSLDDPARPFSSSTVLFDESTLTQHTRMRLVHDNNLVPNSTVLVPLLDGQGDLREGTVGRNDGVFTYEKQAFLGERKVSSSHFQMSGIDSCGLR